jgi:integrase/recombinase XerC
MNNAEVIDAHLAWTRVRNLRPNTTYARRRTLIRFAATLGAPVLAADVDQLDAWQAGRAATLKPGSLAAECSHIRAFYAWAVQHGHVDSNPTRRLAVPRVPRRVPRPIPDAALKIALDAATGREWVILHLAAYCGLRACEIAALSWRDVILDQVPPLIVVDGKGGRQRIVPLPARVIDVLKACTRGGSLAPVVPRMNGRTHCTPYLISHLANNYLHSIGIPQTLHQLRHRAATSWYSVSGDLRAVQELLGHASPATTAGYAAHSPVEAARIVDAAAS